MFHLNQFRKEWPVFIQAYAAEISADSKKLGELYCQKIEAINEFYCMLEQKQLTFRIFKQRIEMTLNPRKEVSLYIQKIKEKLQSESVGSKQQEAAKLEQNEDNLSQTSALILEFYSKYHHYTDKMEQQSKK